MTHTTTMPTIDCKVYSPRFGHEDTWRFTPVDTGWRIWIGTHAADIQINPRTHEVETERFTDRAHNDMVYLPDVAVDFLAWVWVQWQEQTTSAEEITRAVNDLCDWINVVNRSRPRPGSRLMQEYC